MPQRQLDHFTRLPLLAAPTPLEHLPRLSHHIGRNIYIKRDDLTGLAFGGNKLRKLEFLAADALRQGADTLITAGAIQSNHVRQTAAVAAKLGLHCVALLENPIASHADNYLNNGNRLLLDLFNVQVEMCQALAAPEQQLDQLAERIAAQGYRPYVIPVGGSSAIGALGYLVCADEIMQQTEQIDPFAAVVVACGSAGTYAGLLAGLELWQPQCPLIGVTVSRQTQQQLPIVDTLRQQLETLLSCNINRSITLWDDYFAPAYGVPNPSGLEAVKLLAQLEGILLDPVYTGKAMAGLLDGITQNRFAPGPLLFIHTGGAPALFAYHRHAE